MSAPYLSLLVAMTRNRVIGRNGSMPWHIPADLRHFRKTTLGKPVIMGRKTYESIGRPLNKRLNIILSRDPTFYVDGARVFRDIGIALDEAVAAARAAGVDEAVVIGGAQVFSLTMAQARRIYLTLLPVDLEGDTVFPEIDAAFAEISRQPFPPDENATHPAELIILERTEPKGASDA